MSFSNISSVPVSIAQRTPVTAVDTTTGKESSTYNDIMKFGENFDDFLQLLMAQMQNQDPMEPMDTTEFTNQLVQFAEIEQSLKQSDKFDELIASNTRIAESLISNQNSAALDYLGHKVEFEGDYTYLKHNEADFSFTLPTTLDDAFVSVYDANNNLVSGEEMQNLANGKNHYLWDGKDLNGNPLPEGNYHLEVTAIDKSAPESAPTAFTAAGGDVDFTYDLPNTYDKVKLDIIDASGNVATSISIDGAPLSAGTNTFTWDGTNPATGTTLADGNYTVRPTGYSDIPFAQENMAFLQDYDAEFIYSLPERASDVEIEIYAGDVVNFETATPLYTEMLTNVAAGGHQVTWNGQKNNGDEALPGVYSVRVTAHDETGRKMEGIEQRSIARIEQVVPDAQDPILMSEALEIKMSSVISVIQ
ncbi:MAG: FlgD immunoglobulin-like domain containing protein [Alphaproteobacteria bacterium]